MLVHNNQISVVINKIKISKLCKLQLYLNKKFIIYRYNIFNTLKILVDRYILNYTLIIYLIINNCL
jgi:hypothetical protein